MWLAIEIMRGAVVSKVRGHAIRILLLTAVIAISTAPASAVSDKEAPNTILAQTDSVVITKNGEWIYYEHTDELGNAEQRTYEGQHDLDGGCTFSGSETVVSETAEVIEEREIAANLDDCIVVTEIGTQPTPGEDEPPDGIATETEQESDYGMGDDDGGVGIMATTGAWHRTYFTEPAGLYVTSAKTTVRWTYSGGCVTSAWDRNAYYNWRSGTGWQKLQSDTTRARICSYARTTSNSYFANLVFCPPVTGTDYIPNRIRGLSNGAYDMYWVWRKHGSCTGLLTFRRQHGRL